MKISKKKIKAYALKNAISYKGKANQGAIISALFNEGLKKTEVKDYTKIISEIIKEINSLPLREQEKEFEKLKEIVSEREERQGLQDLPNVKKSGVVMRFAPSPSGALHIGHAITACLSFDYVMKYGGKFIVRIEDTNPDNIYPKAYGLIEKDSRWLFDGKAKIVIQSDRMELYYKYAEKLIRDGHAYVCTCSGDEFRKYSTKRKDCPCRNFNPKENKERWENMFDEMLQPGDAVLRFKSEMTNPNPAMRDFPLARINDTKHARQGKKYRVWPLMNLSVSADDIEMKMTHIIRAKEHMDNAKRQKMIFDVLGKKFPWTGFLGRYHFKDLELSASKITQDVEEGKYSGWDDPKLPTIAALRKKGYKPQAFWKFSEHRGLSEVDKTLDKKEFFRLLDEFND